jgi:hypothetical protein
MRPPQWCHMHHPSLLLHQFSNRTGKPYPDLLHDEASHQMSMRVLTPSLSAHRFWGANWQTSFHLVWRPKLRNRRSGVAANHWQTIATSFEAKLENTCFLSPPRVWCGSHTASLDLPIVRPLSTRLVPDHPQSSAPSLLLLLQSSSLAAMSHSPSTFHETSKHVSPHRITEHRLVQLKCAKFILKLEQVNYCNTPCYGSPDYFLITFIIGLIMLRALWLIKL